VAEDAVTRQRTPKGKVAILHNGVEPDDVFVPPTDEFVRILAVANLIAYKGHEVLLRAFARMLEMGEIVNVELHLAGAGPEEVGLRRLGAQLGLADRITFLGSVSDVPERLRDASFSVLSSLSEGFPNAVLESLARGRAVVATSVGGAKEILERGGGLLVPPGDIEALASAMYRLVQNPGLRLSLGREGLELVRREFSLDQLAERSLVMYDEILQRKRPYERI
jgi:glycosyltransferase involved in cell wall biosynthesis